ncbi:hypothetical protein [Streptomyces sp. Edi2]
MEALAPSGRLAVCRVALRSRERLAALRPHNGILGRLRGVISGCG